MNITPIAPADITPGMSIEWGAGNYYTVVACKPSKVGMRATLAFAGREREAHILDGDTVHVITA